MTNLLTPADVAEQLSLSVWQVEKLIRTGKLAAVNLSTGKRPTYRVRPRDLDDYLAASAAGPKPRRDVRRGRPRMPADIIRRFS